MTDPELAAPTAAAPVDAPLSYSGQTEDVFRIWLLNLALNVCTLGVYSFWGRTRMRRYLWSRVALAGDAFEYTGTGKELFLGFLVTLPILIGFGTAFTLVSQDPDLIGWLLPVYAGFFYLYFVGYYASYRYLMSRTTWRGIRGRLGGSAWVFGLVALGATLLSAVTFGVMIPVADVIRIKYQMKNTWFGETQGVFEESDDNLFGIHMLTALLAIPTFGLSRIWYAAAVERMRYRSFKIGDLGFQCTYTGGALTKLALGNLVILLLTLGLGMALVIQRNIRLFAANIAVVGDVSAAVATIAQSRAALSKTGEGLGGALNVDVGIA